MHRSAPIRRACAAALMVLAAGAHAQDTLRKSGLDDFVRMAQANPPIESVRRGGGMPRPLFHFNGPCHLPSRLISASM